MRSPPTWPAYFTAASYPALSLPQVTPNPAACDSSRLQAPYSGGMLAGIGDGRVRMVSPGVAAFSWNLVLNPSYGQVFDSSW